MKKTVFVPHKPSDEYNYSKAVHFGEIKILLEFTQPVFDFPRIKASIEEGLAAFKEGDFLLVSGNHVIYSMALAFLFARFDEIPLLIYSKKFDRYESYTLRLPAVGNQDR